MIKAEDGKVTFRGIRSDIIAEAVTILHTLKKVVSEEEYKMVIRLADKSEKQLSGEVEGAREMLKNLLGL